MTATRLEPRAVDGPGGGRGDYQFIDYATQGYVAVVGALVALFHGDAVPHWPWVVAGHAAGLGLIHGLIRLHARYRRNRLLDLVRHFYPVLLYTALYRESIALNQMFFHGYLDPWFIRWEERLFGGQPSIALMERLPYLAVSELLYVSYFSYYVMIAGVGVALFCRDRRQFFHYVSVVSFVFYVCYLCYLILPVIGPRVFFQDFPGYEWPGGARPGELQTAYPPAVTGGPFFGVMKFIFAHFASSGAAFPSSHVAIALCTLYFSRRYLPAVRFVHGGFVLLLCVATVYCRYHYVVDTVAGVLTAAALVPLGNWLYHRYGAGGENLRAPA